MLRRSLEEREIGFNWVLSNPRKISEDRQVPALWSSISKSILKH